MGTAGPSATRGWKPAATVVLVLVGLAVPTWVQLMPSWGSIDEEVAPDAGDSVLLMWVMGSVVEGRPSGPAEILDGNIFHPYDDALAWSDNLLLFAPVFGGAKWVAGGNPVTAFNVVSFVAYLAGAGCVFALARWLTRSTIGAFAAALFFTTTQYRSVAVGHTQLAGCFTAALGLLFLFRFLRDRKVADVVWLGVSVAMAWYTAAYFAVLLVVMLPAVAGVWLVQRLVRPTWVLRPALGRELFGGAVLSAMVASVLILPSLPAYLRLQRLDVFDRSDATIASGRWSYLWELPPSPLYRAVLGQEHRLGDRGGWFPGLVVVALLALLVGHLLRLAWRRTKLRGTWTAAGFGDEAPRPSRRQEFALPLVAGGALAFVLSFGPASRPWSYPFRALRRVVPGMESVRDTGRFWLPVALVLACLAGAVVAELVARINRRERWSLAVGVVLVVLVLGESTYRPRFVTIDRSEETLAVYRTLATMPDGVVTEAPPAMVTASYPYVAVARQLNSLHDGKPRIEGYSGATPPDLPLFETAKLDLTDPGVLALLRRFEVRYLVLHVGDRACVGWYSPGETDAIVADLQGRPEVVDIIEVPGSADLIVELAPSDDLADRPVVGSVPGDPVDRALSCS